MVPIERPENLSELVFSYVMAPLNEDVFGRARVLAIEAKEKFYAKVIFIDEGISAIVALDALIEMKSSFFYHPWQAFAVAIFGCEPARVLNGNLLTLLSKEKPDRTWDEAATQELRRMLLKFPFVQVEAIHDSTSTNATGDVIRVLMWGVQTPKVGVSSDESRILLNPFFAFRCRALVDYKREFTSAVEQEIFEAASEDQEDLESQIEALPVWRVVLPDQ
ncbi:hypothetical protein L596_014739 [Steinernema carpocapsae]|nr:hypothetical protein L596_014739 [Steinernema carpocapsae]